MERVFKFHRIRETHQNANSIDETAEGTDGMNVVCHALPAGRLAGEAA